MKAMRALKAGTVLAAWGTMLTIGWVGPAHGQQQRMITSGEVRCAIKSWWHPSGHHFYAPAMDGNPPGWTPEVVRFVTFAPKVSSIMVPLYRMFRPGGGHFYTTNESERNSLVAQRGFVDERHIGYVYTQAYADLVALHRWYKPAIDRHFYSTDKAEGDRAGFTYEGVIGYVRPASTAGQNEMNCSTQGLLSGAAAAAAPAAPPPAAAAATAGLQFSQKLDLSQLQVSLVAALNNTSALANAEPLTTVAPLANANPLNNTSAFTMPMGNNLSAGRGVQSMITGSVGVLHLSGASRAADLKCVEWTGSAFQVTGPGNCAREPRRSVFAFTPAGKIHWVDPANGQPSKTCLSAFSDRTVGAAACESAIQWVLNPKDREALSPAGAEDLALAGRPLPNAAAAGAWMLTLQPLGAPASNWHWSLMAVPRAAR